MENSFTNPGDKLRRWTAFSQVITVLLAPIALLVIALPTILSLWSGKSAATELEIIAHRDDTSRDSWTLSGRVRQDGNDVAGARVWVTLQGVQGDRYSPSAVITAGDGQFTFANLPAALNAQSIRSAVIEARMTKDRRELKGEEILRSGRMTSSGTTGPPAVIGSLAAVLLLSMLLPFLGSTPGRTRYVLSMVLTVLFSFSMIGSLGYAVYKVHSPENAGQAPSLGFISIFQGTYLDNGPEQWLVSLTDQPRETPHADQAASAAAVGDATAASVTGQPVPVAKEKGFGAPLWVLLLAAVGTGILTVSLITREIRVPPDDKPAAIREKIYNAVQHQVYVLFSPICAIFVYQTMIMTNTAGQPLIVALATLGAGAALNVLLKYAVENATTLFSNQAPATHAEHPEDAERPEFPKAKAAGVGAH